MDNKNSIFLAFGSKSDKILHKNKKVTPRINQVNLHEFFCSYMTHRSKLPAKPGTKVRRENTRSRSDLDLFVFLLRTGGYAQVGSFLSLRVQRNHVALGCTGYSRNYSSFDQLFTTGCKPLQSIKLEL